VRSTVLEQHRMDHELSRLFASDPDAMADPVPLWRALRDGPSVYRHEARAIVSRYTLVKAALRDPTRLNNRSYTEGTLARSVMAGLSDAEVQAFNEVHGFEAMYVSRTDGETHDRLRGVANRVFTPRRVMEMRDSVQRSINDLLATVKDDEIVDATVLAYQLPLTVICDMLGVQHADREMVHEWSNRLARNRGGTDRVALLDAYDAMVEFRDYVDAIIRDLERGRGDHTTLVAALLEASESDRLLREELTPMFVLLLFAGQETTTNLIGTGLLELLGAPEQWRQLCSSPDLIANAVEELLRTVSPVQYHARVAAEDLVIDDVPVEEGETVYLMLAAANRDHEVFVDPDHVDVTRANSKQHLSFGHGVHFCLGNALARLEANLIFSSLSQRFPNIELASESVTWHGNSKHRRLTALPVRLGQERHGG
jgi:cytochrome P450